MKQAIYLAGDVEADNAIERGLIFAGARIYHPQTMDEALTVIEHRANEKFYTTSRTHDTVMVLVAEVSAGAFSMLESLHQRGIKAPPTMLVDRKGDDLRLPMKALRLGVKEYVIPADGDATRESRARKLVEDCARAISPKSPIPANNGFRQSFARRIPNPNASLDLRWDLESHTIYIGDRDRVQLSPAEARTFDLLFTKRGSAVSLKELIEVTLTPSGENNLHKEIQLLRTHMARLRRRLAANQNFGYRIENLRGAGYTML
jgi:DNA-binding response OmpR family regulator